MEYQAVIGLEVHAELRTRSKMFCACPVVDSTLVAPNTAVCPVCAGLPGALPVVNRQAVEFSLRVALALECQVAPISLFARKNYFYPDLPKGYQITQYEYPLAEHGRLVVDTSQGERAIRVRRIHLEEDAGKLTHVSRGAESCSLVDLNRAGVPLLEIVSEPDMHTLEEVRAYAAGLRDILRYLGVNSGDMEKGVLRFEANISVRPIGSTVLGTRTEIKNLNSFRALERSAAFEIARQSSLLDRGEKVRQETLGWDEAEGRTRTQRSKEDVHDYRYFPEPDLPPLVVETEWVQRVAAGMPELPRARIERFVRQMGLSPANARLIAAEPDVAAYFEECVRLAPDLPVSALGNWITGELFGWMKQSGQTVDELRVRPAGLVELARACAGGEINLPSAKLVLAGMLASGQTAAQIIDARGLRQVSDHRATETWVRETLAEFPQEVAAYRAGKEALLHWFFGQVMRRAAGKANPQVVRKELEKQLRV